MEDESRKRLSSVSYTQQGSGNKVMCLPRNLWKTREGNTRVAPVTYNRTVLMKYDGMYRRQEKET